MTDIVGKLWGFCHTLRHDGIDYGDYIEQLTYLLFLKMIEERGVEIPDETKWTALNVDVKAAAYEGLFEKSASEVKKGAGQYFILHVWDSIMLLSE